MAKIHWVEEQKLREEIRQMKPRDWFFKVLKAELKKLDRWKDLPRGKPGFHH